MTKLIGHAVDGRGMYWKTYLGNTGVQACPAGKQGL